MPGWYVIEVEPIIFTHILDWLPKVIFYWQIKFLWFWVSQASPICKLSELYENCLITIIDDHYVPESSCILIKNTFFLSHFMHTDRNNHNKDLFTFVVTSTILSHSAQSSIFVSNVMSTVTTAAGTGVGWHGQAGLQEHIAGQREPRLYDPVLAPWHRGDRVQAG